MTSKRLRRETKIAQVYDSEILPPWAQRFGRMLLRNLDVPPKATVLDVLCGTGYPSLELLQRSGPGVRVVAIDPSPAMLDVARHKAGALAGRRIFFRSDPAEPRLPFDSDVYDLVLSNLGLTDVTEPRALLLEMVRVAKPGARVAATLPLRGTFSEFYELLAQVLKDKQLEDAERRLHAHLSTMPSVVEAKSWLVEAGLSEVRVECDPFTLLFAGGRDLFFAPVIEYGPLLAWKAVVGPGPHMQEVFWQLKEEIERGCHPAEGAVPILPFSLTVRAGCLSGRKPAPEDQGE